MFLSQLGNNESMKDSIRKASEKGMPIYAECGGLMYMTEAVTDFEGNTYPMVGIVPATCEMQQKLTTCRLCKCYYVGAKYFRVCERYFTGT